MCITGEQDNRNMVLDVACLCGMLNQSFLKRKFDDDFLFCLEFDLSSKSKYMALILYSLMITFDPDNVSKSNII